MKKILIANRGEIALRIMKTASRMGIKTVAVYSEADRSAPYVIYADEAVLLGKAPSSESYLNIEKVIAAAKKSRVDAIHPGYGFLSENAVFARMVVENGFIFIGPASRSIEIMGNKLAAKEAVKEYDIPMVPGTEEAILDVKSASQIAKEIGLPVLIKAAAGGGGKGMRIVRTLEELPEQMDRAISEAKTAFGDGSVFIEKYIASPRHIEIQILADNHGHIVHLFERECSIQRRHQKVVEEAPSSVLTPAVRSAMGKAAIKVAKSCNYSGAGTVEFLLDADKNFYFLEMNTRLQVEHPVTEMITGIDLVEQQIRIARNEKLSFAQDDIQMKGHAIEVRVYAEDPYDNFLPSMGTLTEYRRPNGKNIRLDDGFREGMDIPIHYDPMISKLITYGENRREAIQQMIRAIKMYTIRGVKTTLPFGKFVCEHEAFVSGNFDTGFINSYYTPENINTWLEEERKLAALLALKCYINFRKSLKLPIQEASQWTTKRKENH